MIPGGYILQPRCFDESDSSHFPPCTREVWYYVLRNVNHSDNGRYKRGQAFFKFINIQNALHWYVGNSPRKYSKPQITKALQRLSVERMLETAKATRGIIVTILNYDYYQDPGNYEGNGVGRVQEECKSSGGHTKNKKLRSKKEEVKEPKPSLSSGDDAPESFKAQNIFDLWNQNKADEQPKAAKLTASRRTHANARLKEEPSREYWQGIIDTLANSPFCCGDNNRGWKASFDFLIQPNTHVKAIEGAYQSSDQQTTNGQHGNMPNLR